MGTAAWMGDRENPFPPSSGPETHPHTPTPTASPFHTQRYLKRLYFSTHQIARTPSFHRIFFPSSYVRPE